LALDEGLDDALNIAGYWTLGVTKGFLVAIVPIAVASLAWGFSQRIINRGDRFGRGE